MKIALVSTMVPFVDGGARQIVDWLEYHLVDRGHDVEKVYLPEVDSPGLLFRQMTAFRLLNLSAADRVVCFRPQSHVIEHPHKILWFIHHVRMFYDLWESDHLDFDRSGKHIGIRQALHEVDTKTITEAKRVFTNSKVVSKRLLHFNGIKSEVLYPPLFHPERFFKQGFNDEIVCISRIESHKRQHLLVEALAHTSTPVKLRLCGTSSSAGYVDELLSRVERLGVEDRFSFDQRWISEDEKVVLLSNCLASAYVPADEDSYGYPTLEAAHSEKTTITTSDSGGVLEFVEDGVSGFVCDPDPTSIAEAMDSLWNDRRLAEDLGSGAKSKLSDLEIDWNHVVNRILE